MRMQPTVLEAVTDSNVPCARCMCVLENFFREAGAKLSVKTGAPAPINTKFSEWKEFLRKLGVIENDDEQALLQNLCNFLSNAGTHALTSTPVQLHVVHVTVVEWCMLLAGRVRTLS